MIFCLLSDVSETEPTEEAVALHISRFALRTNRRILPQLHGTKPWSRDHRPIADDPLEPCSAAVTLVFEFFSVDDVYHIIVFIYFLRLIIYHLR